MTVQETTKIIYVIKATYPNSFKGYTEKDYDNMIAAWGSVMSDYTYEQASAGLKIYLSSDTKGFPPSPGQVIDCISKMITMPELEMTALEAWHLVHKAICNSGYNSVEEFEKLPEACKKAVGNPANLREWAMMDSETVNSVEQSHFIRSYDTVVRRMKEEAKLPASVKALIAGVKREALNG